MKSHTIRRFVPVLASCVLVGCSDSKPTSKVTSQPPPPEPIVAPTPVQVVTPDPTPALPPVVRKPEKVAESVANAPVLLVRDWTDFDEIWTRKGKSNVFDVDARNLRTGEQQIRVATLIITGREVRGTREDGINFDGVVSEDGKRIRGVVSNKEGRAGWFLRLPSVVGIEEPPKPRLAPVGTLFLLEYVGIRTKAGVDGVTPGTKLKLLVDKGDTVQVTDGEHTFDTAKVTVTNDLNRAYAAASADAQEQSEIAAMIAKEDANSRAMQEWQNGQYAERASEAGRRIASPGVGINSGNPLNRPATTVSSGGGGVWSGGYSDDAPTLPFSRGATTDGQSRELSALNARLDYKDRTRADILNFEKSRLNNAGFGRSFEDQRVIGDRIRDIEKELNSLNQ